jgi:hypothetical protein
MKTVVLSFLVLTVSAAELKVDHATIAGLDLQTMQKDLEAEGLPSEFGGKHANRATEMAIVSFADGSYIELIAKQPDVDPKSFGEHAWAKFIESNAGPCAWAVRPNNLAAEVDRLRAAGAAVDNITPSGRTRSDGVRLEWETAQPHGDRGGFFPFLIHDLTPRDNRVYPSGKPNAPQYTGIAKVVIAVKDLDGAIAKYRKAYNLNAPRREMDARLDARTASFDGTPVVLATPATTQNWMADRIAKYGDLPCEFGLRNSKTGEMKWVR